MATRSHNDRIVDALRRLETDRNVWISTSSPDGTPHLVPLSLGWDGLRILVATPSATPTARNVAATGKARAALDDADDVVLIAADAQEIPFAEAAEETVEVLVNRIGWSPADESGVWSLLALTPHMVHAWRGVSEIDRRTIMKSGAWLRTERNG